jgi:hypothetical protein
MSLHHPFGVVPSHFPPFPPYLIMLLSHDLPHGQILNAQREHNSSPTSSPLLLFSSTLDPPQPSPLTPHLLAPCSSPLCPSPLASLPPCPLLLALLAPLPSSPPCPPCPSPLVTTPLTQAHSSLIHLILAPMRLPQAFSVLFRQRVHSPLPLSLSCDTMQLSIHLARFFLITFNLF